MTRIIIYMYVHVLYDVFCDYYWYNIISINIIITDIFTLITVVTYVCIHIQLQERKFDIILLYYIAINYALIFIYYTKSCMYTCCIVLSRQCMSSCYNNMYIQYKCMLECICAHVYIYIYIYIIL